MKTRVCITIDVEPSVAGAFSEGSRFSPLFDEPVLCEIDGRSEGLGFIRRTLEEFELKATFFIEALHTAHFGQSRMGRQVELLKADDQDVQLHVHPCWLRYCDGLLDPASRMSDLCADFTEARLVDIFERGKAQLERWTGARTVALRTGGFSVSPPVYAAMAAVGLQASSNICVGYSPPAECALRVPGGFRTIEGILEFPVTCFRDEGPLSRGNYRGMQITACASWELAALLRAAHEESYPCVVIVTHPFEFVKRNSFRYERMTTNRINQNRLRSLCGFLRDNPDLFEISTISELASQSLETAGAQELSPLVSGMAPSILRTAQNVLNDYVWAL